MVLWTLQSSLDGILFGMVGAEARTQQTMHPLGVGLEGCGFAGDDTPSDAPSGDEVILRHSTKGHARHVGSNRSERDVRRSVEDQLVVDFVRKDNQVIAAGQLRDALQHLPGTQRTGRIIRIY